MTWAWMKNRKHSQKNSIFVVIIIDSNKTTKMHQQGWMICLVQLRNKCMEIFNHFIRACCFQKGLNHYKWRNPLNTLITKCTSPKILITKWVSTEIKSPIPYQIMYQMVAAIWRIMSSWNTKWFKELILLIY